MHKHTPRNVNEQHADERLSINDRLAVYIVQHVGTMMCAYVFAGIGIGSIVGVLTGNFFLATLCGSVSSYFLQLVLLPIIVVGQNVQSRHAELMAEEQYRTTQQTFADSEHMKAELAEIKALLVKERAS